MRILLLKFSFLLYNHLYRSDYAMKQIEITVRLSENMQSAIRKLEMQGFKKIRESEIEDVYMTSKLKWLKQDNIQDILKKSVLLRNLKLDGKEIKKITYKDKEIDENGDVVSERKINLECSDLEKAKDLFEYLEFEKLINVRYKVVVYSKDKVEYAFQDVENLGTLIEYENIEDFEERTLHDGSFILCRIGNESINFFDELSKNNINELIKKINLAKLRISSSLCIKHLKQVY